MLPFNTFDFAQSSVVVNPECYNQTKCLHVHQVSLPLGVQLSGWRLFRRSAVQCPDQRQCLQSMNGRQRHTMHKVLKPAKIVR